MRGKAQNKLFWFVHFGITPAYAGKSIIHHSGTFVKRDHPRLCGEKLALAGQFTGKVGSPPPMRGKEI